MRFSNDHDWWGQWWRCWRCQRWSKGLRRRAMKKLFSIMHEAAISRFSHQIIMTMMMDNNDENSNMHSILHPCPFSGCRAYLFSHFWKIAVCPQKHLEFLMIAKHAWSQPKVFWANTLKGKMVCRAFSANISPEWLLWRWMVRLAWSSTYIPSLRTTTCNAAVKARNQSKV